MPPIKTFCFFFVLVGAACSPTWAALHDTGPMGPTASGAPTPDAAVLSGARLPDLATPVPATITAVVIPTRTATRSKRSLAQKAGSQAVWVQMENLSKRIDTSERLAKLPPDRATVLRSDLDEIRDSYSLHVRTGELRLNIKERRSARSALERLERKLDHLLLPQTAENPSLR